MSLARRHGRFVLLFCVVVALPGISLARGLASSVRITGIGNVPDATVVPSYAAPSSVTADDYQALKDAFQVTLSDFALEDGRSVTLSLTQFDVFAPDGYVVIASSQGEQQAPRPEVALFRGSVVEDAGATVFLSVSPYGVQGILEMSDGRRIVTSGPYLMNLPTIVYNLDTLPEGEITWETFHCQVLNPPDSGSDTNGDEYGLRDTTCKQNDLAIDTDWEFTGSLFGGDTNASGAYAASLIGAIAEIYRRDVSVDLQISYLRLWSNSGDPWNASNTSNQLNQFQDYWNNNMTTVVRDLAHMLSGRGLGGGVAYLGVLCNHTSGYAVSANLGGSFPYPLQDYHWNNWDVMVVAHELGHNHGAPHTHETSPLIDGCGNGDCDPPLGTIMSYCHLCDGGMSNIALHFHPQIISANMLPHIATATCLASSKPAIVQQPNSAWVSLGEPASMTALGSSSSGSVSYRWYKDDVALTNTSNITGVNAATLSIASVQASDLGSYKVEVYDGCGTVVSNTARVVTALGAGDCNCDGVIDLFDIDGFVDALTNSFAYWAHNPNCDIYLADMNGDKAINNFDIDPFIAALLDK